MRRPPLAALLVSLLLAAGCGVEEQSDGDGGAGGEGAETTQQESGTTGGASTGREDLPDRIAVGEIPQPELDTREVVIEGSDGEVRVEAEVADDDPERFRGLMAREELGPDEGMLFVFDSEEPLNFVMENTLLSLSIAYIDSEGRIVNILDMAPLDENTYPSEEPAQYALEVNQGFFEENGVEIGDRVNLPS